MLPEEQGRSVPRVWVLADHVCISIKFLGTHQCQAMLEVLLVVLETKIGLGDVTWAIHI